MESMRINRYLSYFGVCSRREADRLVDDGRVKIGDRVAVPGDKVSEADTVFVDGKVVEKEHETVFLAYNKPVGVICTTSEKERPNLNDVIDIGTRLFPIGRLDKDSSGLLLLTNDGMMADELMRSRNDHEKEYVVRTDKPLSPEVIRAMEQGVPLDGGLTKPCRITDVDGKYFHIVLTQGLNRQIRRMCEYFGYRVVRLKRIRFVSVMLDDLAEGSFRYLDDAEIALLKND